MKWKFSIVYDTDTEIYQADIKSLGLLRRDPDKENTLLKVREIVLELCQRLPAPPVVVGNGRYRGKVKWFNDAKGYGFIIPDDGSVDVFVHHRGIDMPGRRTLVDGQAVEYEQMPGNKGGIQGWKVKPLPQEGV